jgi:hypothetical protein
LLIVALIVCLAILFVSGAFRRAFQVIDRAVLCDVIDGTRRPGGSREPRITAELWPEGDQRDLAHRHAQH